MSLRTSAHTGVAILRMRGRTHRKGVIARPQAVAISCIELIGFPLPKGHKTTHVIPTKAKPRGGIFCTAANRKRKDPSTSLGMTALFGKQMES